MTKIISYYSKIKNKLLRVKNHENLIENYIKSGRKPWSLGYHEFKELFIKSILNDSLFLEKFLNKEILPENYGFGIDERCVEYPWIFSKLSSKFNNSILDAGSIFNYEFLLKHEILKKNKLHIYTLDFEGISYTNLGISYVYGDLRTTPYKENYFDIVCSISTLEHVGMDNSIYTKNEIFKESKNHDYLIAFKEIIRILKPKGIIYITLPYGKFLNMGYYQQFNDEMIKGFTSEKSVTLLSMDFLQYSERGWQWSNQESCSKSVPFDIHNSKYFNKNSNIDYDTDLAACSRAIICLEFRKNEL